MKLLFSTKNGSNYVLDKDLMRWERISRASESGTIRKESGTMLDWPKVELGKGVLIFDTSVAVGCVAHGVWTSPVVEIKELGDA